MVSINVRRDSVNSCENFRMARSTCSAPIVAVNVTEQFPARRERSCFWGGIVAPRLIVDALCGADRRRRMVAAADESTNAPECSKLLRPRLTLMVERTLWC